MRSLWHQLGQRVSWRLSPTYKGPRHKGILFWLFRRLWRGHVFQAFGPTDIRAAMSDDVHPLFESQRR